MRNVLGVLGLAVSLVACGAPSDADLEVESLQSAITLTGTVSHPNSQCNSTVQPNAFVVAPGGSSVVDLVMPSGWTVQGWSCANGHCTKSFTGSSAPSQQTLVLTHAGDPQHQSGGMMLVAPPSPPVPTVFPLPGGGRYVCIDGWNPGTTICKFVAPVACCTCPCDANPGCQ